MLESIRRCLNPGGKVFLQFAGKGNAIEILELADQVISSQKWSKYFQNFEFPYGFFGPDEYRSGLDQSGLRTIRIELIPKEMIQPDLDGLSSWIETTWLPYTSRVPDELRYEFIHQIAESYVELNPLGKDGKFHLRMVRLEIEAEKS